MSEDVHRALLCADEPSEFEQIARDWEKYFVVDVELMICVLRRWVQITPASKEAKRVLGSYLLFHGPDWDEKAKKLIEQAS